MNLYDEVPDLEDQPPPPEDSVITAVKSFLADTGYKAIDPNPYTTSDGLVKLLGAVWHSLFSFDAELREGWDTMNNAFNKARNAYQNPSPPASSNARHISGALNGL